ncbi:MAG: ABC transporter ATP-binding protein [Thermoplasmatota archaeon]
MRVTTGAPAIHTDALTKRYGSQLAVDALSIDVPARGVIGFVGHNGAGKTTTIRMLLGLIRPTSGSATVLGESIEHPARFLHRVGALIESPSFHPGLSARKNLRALAILGGHDLARIDPLLAQVGLADRADDPYKSFSLGMKQRLGIAASLVPDPELLMLDEPTNGLDPAGIREMRGFLRALGDQGKTVFVSSHLLAEVQRMCDHLVILRRGRLVFDGPLAALIEKHGGIVACAEDPARNAEVAALAREAGFAAALEGGKVRVVAPAKFAAELNRLAMKRGITLAELGERTADLESLVLDMTEGAGGQ